MAYTLSPLVHKFSPWSYSKVSHLFDCPFSFNRLYIQGIKEKQRTYGGGASGIGNALHTVLEKHLCGAPISDIRKIAEDACLQQTLTSVEVEKVASSLRSVKLFIERIDNFKTKHGIVNTLIENKFGFDSNFTATGFWSKNVFFRGIWDVMMFAGNNDIIIIDHKSGMAPADANTAWDHYGKQRRFYAIAALAQFPQLRSVHAALHYIQDEKIYWAEKVPAEEIREVYIPWCVDFLNTQVEKIEAGEPKKGWRCAKTCGHRDACPIQNS